MSRLLASLSLILLCLFVSFSPVLAAGDLPEPFCGDLDEEDCTLLRESNAAMLDLSSYSTAVEYKVLQHGIPELPPESEAVLRVEGQYAFDRRARESMRTLAIISRDEPLAAVQKLGESPDLLINLYDGMTADLFLTLDLSQSWTHLLEEEADLEWPTRRPSRCVLSTGCSILILRS
ncbi:MAG TPA: hypothetical protein PKE45_17200 [Caldilineaceae bacterium]|nr:hypothetical protein [Caldilineaceae bacterium]